MTRKDAWLTFLLSMVLLMFGQGCGVYMAFTQPPPANTNAFNVGDVDRGFVMAVCGFPVSSKKKDDGGRIDVYQYYEGSSSGWSAGRGVFHLLADIFTLALWEIIATPSEFAIRGDKLTAQAEFDSDETLVSFQVLSRVEAPLGKIHEDNGF